MLTQNPIRDILVSEEGVLVMNKKSKTIFIITAVIITAFAFIYKFPKGMDNILPYPYDFENAFSHNCIAGIPEKQRMHFPPDKGKLSYDEIHNLLAEAKFISDFRNLAPVKYSFPKFAISGSRMFINHNGASISVDFYSGIVGTGRCTVNFLDDGTVYITTMEYSDVIWSYKLTDKNYFEKLWNYSEENGSV